MSVAYQVPKIYKDKILKKANSAWKNWKGELRKICDRGETVAERKSIVVEDIKKEDWEAFVELHSINEDQDCRDCERNARKNVKILHTTSRNGCVRVAHELVFGRDCKGYVHGMTQGVSKTEIRALAASWEIARREKQKNDALINQIETLEQIISSLQAASVISSLQAARCNTLDQVNRHPSFTLLVLLGDMSRLPCP